MDKSYTPRLEHKNPDTPNCNAVSTNNCNASPVLKERAEMMALHEGMTYERDAEKRAPYA